jgi:hypothetical protein
MNRLTLGDIKLGLEDLLSVRLDDLKQSAFGGLYLPLLTAKQGAIDALPDAMTSGLPLAAQLAETDVDHDGLGGSVWFVTEAVLRHPTLTPALREAAVAIRTAFVPELAVLRKPHADEAAAAYNHRADLTRLEGRAEVHHRSRGANALHVGERLPRQRRSTGLAPGPAGAGAGGSRERQARGVAPHRDDWIARAAAQQHPGRGRRGREAAGEV